MKRTATTLGYVAAAVLLGIPALIALGLTVIAFSGWDALNVAAGAGQPGPLWWIIGVIGMGLGSAAIWCLDQIPSKPSRPYVPPSKASSSIPIDVQPPNPNAPVDW